MSMPEMIYRPLGKCGTKVSAFGLGGWATFGESVNSQADVAAIIRAAYDAGVIFFDIADVYAKGESEKLMGKALAEYRRSDLVISTKVYFPMSDKVNDQGLSRKHIFESVEASLKRIGTDYIDVYFCHRFDGNTPIEETARAMDDLIHQGKILYWGTSEWSGDQLQQVHGICDRRHLYAPQVEQPQYNLLFRHRFEKDVAPNAQELGMGTVVWSPLASGLLTGKYDQGVPADSRFGRVGWLRDMMHKPENIDRSRKVQSVADKLSCSRTQLALAWAARHPAVSSVILGATSAEQLQHNLGALALQLSDEDLAKLDELCPATPIG